MKTKVLNKALIGLAAYFLFSVLILPGSAFSGSAGDSCSPQLTKQPQKISRRCPWR
ncbi:hypothetical protein VU07_01325 [Desulfobulbus sp. F4]|nr:hypothetical protein [Desulfobulbus sp. F3]MCW5200445.1 hypothetical protein [Desulfobulbus sp. F4]